jgi:hypothetical protein
MTHMPLARKTIEQVTTKENRQIKAMRKNIRSFMFFLFYTWYLKKHLIIFNTVREIY